MGNRFLHVMQVSTQFTDNTTLFNQDMAYIVGQNPDVVVLSELGLAGRKAAFQAYASANGYTPSNFPGDCQIMVKQQPGCQLKSWGNEFVHDAQGRTGVKYIVWAEYQFHEVTTWNHGAHWVPEAQNGGLLAEQHRDTSREMALQVVRHAKGRAFVTFAGDINADPDRAHYPRSVFRAANMVTVWDEKKIQPITAFSSTIDVIGRHTGREDVRISSYKVHPPQNSDHKFVSVVYELGIAGVGDPIGSGGIGYGGGDGGGGGSGGVGPKPPPLPATDPDPDPRHRLGNLFIHGGKLKDSIAEHVTAAGLSWSTTEVTQLSLSIADPGLDLFRSGVFTKGSSMLYREPGMPDLELRISSVTVGGGPTGTGGLDVAARSLGVGKLKRRRGPLVMKKVSPTAFVEAECKAAGLKIVAQPSAQRGAVSRDVKKKGEATETGSAAPSSWTTVVRLAQELGYWVFEFAGTVYFGQPTWLLKQDKTPLQVALPLPGAPEAWMSRNIPTIVESEDSDVPVEISDIEVEKARFKECRPGGAIQLRGLPHFNDVYLTTSMSMSLIGTGGISLSASTPENPEAQPPAKPKKAGEYDETANGSEPSGARSGARFVEIAITASSASYVYGAEASSSDPTPGALDCSELIEWALGRMGVTYVDGSSAQYAASDKISVERALGIRGALLWQEGHIGISMGDGRSVEARNPSTGVGIFRARDIDWVGGGLIPALTYR